MQAFALLYFGHYFLCRGQLNTNQASRAASRPQAVICASVKKMLYYVFNLIDITASSLMLSLLRATRRSRKDIEHKSNATIYVNS